jgi:hypothetical protein
MRRLLLSIIFLFALPSFAQKEDWLPITQQDLRINAAPGIAGALAIQLYYADYIDDQEQTEFFYRRIKVLNDKGMSYADVEIPVPPDCSVSGLKARTIQPDGKVVEFTGKPFKKILLKQRGLKVVALTFYHARGRGLQHYRIQIQNQFARSLSGQFMDHPARALHRERELPHEALWRAAGGF